ncbi:MAG: branched-chain amino acid ABC transporter permease [Polyangiales bacterium]
MQTPTIQAPSRAPRALAGVKNLPQGSTQRFLLIGLLLLACALPFVVSNYRIFQLNMVFITTMALLGLNLLTGYNGQISLGHGAFYAMGAYVTAILIDQFNVPYPIAIAVAGVACLGLGWGFGLPALRLEGIYLALATFALGVCLPQILKYKGIEEWTGGVQGITLMKPEAPFGLPLSADQWLYFFSFGVLLFLLWVAHNLITSHTGAAIVAIRDNPLAAAAMGIDLARYKTTTFGISAMYTGVAGGLSALTVQFVAPDSFNILVSAGFLVGIIVGGLASLSGAFYGALFLQFVPNLADQISKAAPWAIYGTVLIAFVLLMPAGIAGSVHRFLRLSGTTPKTKPRTNP